MTRPTKVVGLLISIAFVVGCGSSTNPAPAASSSPQVAPTPQIADASPSTGSSLTGPTWALSTVSRKIPALQGVVPSSQQADQTITFNANGTYSGTAACTQIAGTYKTSGNSLTISAGASPLAFCLHSDFWAIFAHSLTEAATYAITNDTLTITLSDGGTITLGALKAVPSRAPSSAVASMAARASPPAEVLGKTWKLTGITEMTLAFQGAVPEADQSKYTIELRPDGTFNAKADCNQVGGMYEVHRGDEQNLPLEPGGGSMSILVGPSTLAACSPGSLADLFMTGLSNISSFAIDANQLALNLGGFGKLQFTA